MQDTALFSPFLSELQTTQDANDIVEQIETILTRLYQNNQRTLLQLLSDHMRPELVNALHKVLSENSNIDNTTSIKTFLDHLKTVISGCEILTLTLAIHPTQSFVTNVARYTKQTLGNNLLLEIVTDPTILSGAIIVYKGNFIDLSVKKKLKNYFSQEQTITHE